MNKPSEAALAVADMLIAKRNGCAPFGWTRERLAQQVELRAAEARQMRLRATEPPSEQV
jgi:hypothetical protein